MPRTERAINEIEAREADLELCAALLMSPSDAKAAVAFHLLRGVLPDRALIMLCNLRELIAEMPETPFLSGAGLEVLQRADDYEFTGRSFRKLFESDHGVYGLEFIGTGKLCDGILVHTAAARFAFRGGGNPGVLDAEILQVLVNHPSLLDEMLSALESLGWPLEPKIYITLDDFAAEHARAAASETFGELF